MRTIIRNTIVLLALLVCGLNVYGQEECSNALYDANALYKSGKINDAINRLEPCINTIKSSTELFEAYRLLGIAYLDLNNEEKWDHYVVLMLHQNPKYQNYPNNDPSEFTRKVLSFNISPLLHLGIKAGMNANSVDIVQSFSAFPYQQVYNVSYGYQFGVSGRYMILPTLGLEADLMYSGISVEHRTTQEGIWQQRYSEQMQFFSPSVSIRKDFSVLDRMTLEVGAGIGAGIMNTSRVYVLSEFLVNPTAEQYTKDGLKERNKVQPNFGAVLGVNYLLETGQIGLEAGYNIYTKTTVHDQKRMDDTEFIYNTQYINDDIKLRLVTLNLTYSVPLLYKVTR